MADALLHMTGIRKAFGATVALDGVDLAVRPGEVHALIGENGAGKSTLMKVLAGAVRPDAGTMRLGAEAYAPRTPADGRAAGVAMIYQELSLAPHLSVMENVLLGVEPVRGPFVRWRDVRRRAAAALAAVGREDIDLAAPVGRLAVADRQLVEIARSVAVGSRVLVLDEPTSSLAAPDIRSLFRLVGRLRDEGHAIVYISHVLEEVQAVADRYTVLRDGRVVAGGAMADATIERLVTAMVGREVADFYPRSPRRPGPVVLELDGLAGVRAPRSASLALRRGEVLGIAGLVGAGRTELLRAVFALDPVASGQVRIGGAVGPASPARRWAAGVGLVSEDRKGEGLATGLDVAANTTLPRLTGLGPVGLVLPSRQRRVTARWVERLGIRCAGPAQQVAALSGGNQQKVAMARLLHADVDVLLLDEPTRGIDIGSKAQIYRLIDELAVGAAGGDGRPARPPRAVLMVSSYLPELLGVCDRIAVMCRGRLGPARSVSELDEHRIMLEATGAEAAA
ncbi:MAG: sugar ABC transporter ATP-binding protein [Planctomycetota bacterium]|jgi:ribose transport system ATP-binding protein